MIFVPPFQSRASSALRRQAFTVIELMMAVTITTIIVVALYAVFDHTQKALRGSITQVDVLESGRSAMELMTREIQQTVAAGVRSRSIRLPDGTQRFTANLSAITEIPSSLLKLKPLIQPLSGNFSRTNVVQELFFLVRSNNYWGCVGYFVASPTNANTRLKEEGYGTLYRYSTLTYPPQRIIDDRGLTNLMTQFNQARLDATKVSGPGPQQLISGVVHFNVKGFNRSGERTDFNFINNRFVNPEPLSDFISQRDGLPAYVELELGILEPQVLEQVKSMGNAAAARTFLEKRAGRVHLFRQRIPIHAAP